MITVHHLNNSRSQRVLWLLEELELPYEIRHYQRNPVTNLAPPELMQVHPLGKSPVITDGDTTVAETGAIIEYLVGRAGGRLRPAPDTPEHRRYTYWMHFAEGSLMSLMLIALVLSRIPEAKDSPVRARILERLARMLEFVDGKLAGHEWFAGDAFTAADVMMSFPLTTMKRYLAFDLSPHENIRVWVARIEARPAYAKAMAIAGPDATSVPGLRGGNTR